MTKLRLDLENLSVESFQTDSGADLRGTVAAHAGSQGCTEGCTLGGSCICSLGDTACDLTWHCSTPGGC